MDILVQIWPIIAFMIGQTVAGIWWAATVSADIRYIKEEIGNLKDDVEKSDNEHKYEVRAIHKRIDLLMKSFANGS